MTKKVFPPESKPTSQTGGGKGAGSEANGTAPMDRFKKLAKQVVTASREQVLAEEKRSKKR